MENVLITGAAIRLGQMIASDLAASGCFVWIHYRSHEAEAYELKAQILGKGGAAECVRADLLRIEEIDGMLRNINCSEHGKLTTLINNASFFSKGKLSEILWDDWDEIMNTNLKAVWYLSTRFAAEFPTAKRIITIGDASVSKGYANHAVYGLSKYVLKYLTEQMAVEFAPKVRVNLLSPGLVLPGADEPDEIWQQRQSRTLLDNGQITDEILNTVRFLMSDPGLTGSELLIDNGLHTAR